jgi:hypothetical protein
MSYRWVKVGDDLIGVGAGDQFGKIVAMSSDGTVVAVGGVTSTTSTLGTFRVLKWNGSTWIGRGGDFYGVSKIALSGDGNTLVLMSVTTYSSGAYIRQYSFSEVSSEWSYSTTYIENNTFYKQIGLSQDGSTHVHSYKLGSLGMNSFAVYRNGTLIYTDNISATDEVSSISMSGGGSVLAIGIMSLSRIQIYDFNGSTYIKRSTDIQYTSPTNSNDRFGYSISMSADGGYLAVGAPDAVENGAANTGRVYIYSLGGGGYSDLGTLYAEASFDNFGTSVALSNSLTIVVGSPNSSSNTDYRQSAGTAHIYTYSGSSWVLKGTAIDSLTANDRLGESVAISTDGSTVILGIPQYDLSSKGRARVYSWLAAPSAPMNLNATPGNGIVTLNWSLPSSSGTTAITNYKITNITTGTISVVPATTRNTTISGLTNSTSYTFTVIATNSIGDSVASNISNTVIPLDNIFVPQYSLFEWLQRGTDLYGENNSDYMGHSISMSSDGRVVAVGEIGNNSNAGRVRIYDWNGSTWSQYGSTIFGETTDNKLGYSISLSADGSIVAIGEPYASEFGFNSGRVRVFGLSIEGVWIQRGMSINGAVPGDQSGFAVSLSSNGSAVAIGAPFNRSTNAYGESTYRTGHVRIFVWNETNWQQLGTEIDGNNNDEQSGYSVSLSSTGSVVAIGSPTNNNSRGRVIVYGWNGSLWSQRGNTIIGDADMNRSGHSISLSSDGSIMAIGSPDSSRGHVRVYNWNGNAWFQRGETIDGEVDMDKAGYSVSLSSDGSIVAIGAPYNDGKGHVRVYVWNSGIWMKCGQDIDGKTTNEQSGFNVSLSSDGSVVAISSPFSDNAKGTVRMYETFFGLSAPIGVNTVEENGKITVKWSPPITNGNHNIISYTVTNQTTGASYIESAATFSKTIDGLTNGIPYSFTVRVANAINSTATTPSVIAIPKTVPGPPTSITATDDNTQASVSWMAPVSNGGAAITSYTVTASPGGATVTTSITSATVTGLAIGTSYTFTVKATNAVGSSAASAPSAGVTPKAPVWTKIGTDIVGEGLGDRFGTCVAMSSDGTVVAIGGPYNDGTGSDAGHVRVYSYNGSTWIQRSTDIDGMTINYYAGTGIALSGNGNVLAVGVTGGNVIRTYTWNASNNLWDRKGDIDVGVNNTAIIGKAISLSDDGTKMALSFKQGAGNTGFLVKSYNFTNGNWDSVVSFDTMTEGNEVTSIKISANGLIVAVCISALSKIFVYENSGSGYTQRGSTSLNPLNATNKYGNSVSMSADGRIIVVGAPGVDGNRGKVYIDAWNANGFVGGVGSIGGESGLDTFGTSVALSADGTILAVGSPKSQTNPAGILNAGTMHIYKRNGTTTTWNLLGAGIDGSTAEDNLGQSVAISKSGNVVIVGVPQLSASKAGLARVYVNAPNAPTNVIATAGNGQATVTWTPPENAEGTLITNYILTDASNNTTLVSGTSTSATVSGLINEKSYTFTVKTKNAAGESAPSTVSNVVTPRDIPARNTALVVSGLAPLQTGTMTRAAFKTLLNEQYRTVYEPYVASFSGVNAAPLYESVAAGVSLANKNMKMAIVKNGETLTIDTASLTSADVLHIPGDAGDAFNLVISGVTYAITFDASGNMKVNGGSPLLPGAQLVLDRTYTVVAKGSGAVVLGTVPSAPTSVTATEGNTQATVSWTDPSNNGGSAITGYTVTNVTTGTTYDVSATVISKIVTDLSNGTAYSFTVKAVNAAGPSVSSSSVSATPRTVPGAPTGVIADLSNGQVTVRWTDPSNNGGSAITGYTVTNVTTNVTYDLSANVTTKTITDLSNGTPYSFTVKAVNAAGSSVPSSVSATPRTIPGAPRSVTADPSNTQVTVSWTDPSNNGGSAITGYTVTNVTTGTTYDVSATVISKIVTDLSNGTAYSFTVKAVNAAGPSVSSSSVSATPRTVPGAPTSVTVASSVGSVTVTWNPPASNGGSEITGYTVSVAGTRAVVTVGPTTYSATVAGLPSAPHNTTVVATNAAGSSSPSAPMMATPLAPAVTCFFGNARVLTPSGYRRMDSLREGDRVKTPEGSVVSIDRVKVSVCPAGPNTNPYVIPVGTFGAEHRVLISPDHRVCLSDGRKVEARRLGLEQEDRSGTLTYYNLELAGQADMVVGGVAVESLAPVKRVVVSLATFEAAIRSRYGVASAAVLDRIKRTCRLVGNDSIEVPVLHQ